MAPANMTLALGRAVSRDDPGQKLRRMREHLQLRYRDVEEASQQIAAQRNNDEFAVGLSRLADIENKGTVPSVYRLYSLCAIYRLDFGTVLRWYGIDLRKLTTDAVGIGLDQTHEVAFDYGPSATVKYAEEAVVNVPTDFDEEIDSRETAYLNRQIHRWGKLPVSLLNSLDLPAHRYGFVGTADWSMHPLLAPGAFIQIDESRRRLGNETWTNEYDRPIYFVEHRRGYRCAWCTRVGEHLILQFHPASHLPPELFRYPGEAEVVGQIVAVAMRLRAAPQPHKRS